VLTHTHTHTHTHAHTHTHTHTHTQCTQSCPVFRKLILIAKNAFFFSFKRESLAA
jgi:hypothetical protein